MKNISYNSRIHNPQEQKLSTLDRELLGILHALEIYEFLIIGSPHPIHKFANNKPPYIVLQKRNPQSLFLPCSNATPKIFHFPIQHEEILPHQKHDSHSILADYGTDQFSIRINDKGNDIIAKPLDPFSFKSITPFQNKYKTPARKNN